MLLRHGKRASASSSSHNDLTQRTWTFLWCMLPHRQQPAYRYVFSMFYMHYFDVYKVSIHTVLTTTIEIIVRNNLVTAWRVTIWAKSVWKRKINRLIELRLICEFGFLWYSNVHSSSRARCVTSWLLYSEHGFVVLILWYVSCTTALFWFGSLWALLSWADNNNFKFPEIDLRGLINLNIANHRLNRNNISVRTQGSHQLTMSLFLATIWYLRLFSSFWYSLSMQIWY